NRKKFESLYEKPINWLFFSPIFRRKIGESGIPSCRAETARAAPPLRGAPWAAISVGFFETKKHSPRFESHTRPTQVGRFSSFASLGESGIRTHETISRLHAFQACSLSHSDISPDKTDRF